MLCLFDNGVMVMYYRHRATDREVKLGVDSRLVAIGQRSGRGSRTAVKFGVLGEHDGR
jgi:hypothetical protein